MLEATMAKRKTTRKPTTPATIRSVAFRVSQEYSDWLEKLAVANRTTISGLIDQAIAGYAKEKGFEAPPERT